MRRNSRLRTTAFRVTAAVMALLLLVGFGVWSAPLMAGVGLAAHFLAIRHTGHTVLASWTAATLSAIGAAGTVPAAIQGQDVLSALLFSIA